MNIAKLLSFLAFAIVSRAHAIEFKSCSETQKKEILASQDLAETLGHKVVSQIKEALDSDREAPIKGNNGKLRESIRYINCAIKHMGKLNYECVHRGTSYDAQTNWVFASKIKVSSTFYMRNEASRAGALMHEFTHKCGTNDMTYFNELNDSPYDIGVFKWSSIADTYEYWLSYGFCIPYETCPEEE